MLDSHCHLADDAFADDLEAVIDRARAVGLTRALCILAVGNARETARASRVRTLWPDVTYAIGVHPHAAGEHAGREDTVATIVHDALAATPSVRAIGEIGLDYHYDLSPRDVQRAVFREQVRLARELRVPIVIHTREAAADTLAIIREAGGGEVRGVFHCFTGDAAMAEEVLALGFHLSFSGIVTFPRAESLRAVARSVPDDRLLVETDSPYLAPVPHRGTRNEPALVVRVIERLAAIRGRREVEVAEATALAFGELIAR